MTQQSSPDSPQSTQDSLQSAVTSPQSLEARIDAVKTAALDAFDKGMEERDVPKPVVAATEEPAKEETKAEEPKSDLAKFLTRKTSEQKERSRILAEAKAKHAEAEQRLQAATKLEQMYGSKLPILEQMEKDPFSALKALGKDPKEMIDYAIANSETDPVAKMQRQIDELKAAYTSNLEAQKRAQEEASMEAQRAAAMKQLDAVRERVYGKTGEEYTYPNIAANFSSENELENRMLQSQLIERMAFYEDLFHKETGEIPTEDQLAEYIETFYASKNPGSAKGQSSTPTTVKSGAKKSPLPSIRMARESQARDIRELPFEDRKELLKQNARETLRKAGL